MLADPQSITISGTGYTLARTGASTNNGTFLSSDGLVSEAVSHQYGKRSRRAFRVVHKKLVPDLLQPSINVYRSTSVTLVVDHPVDGYTPTELLSIISGLITQLTAGSNLVGGKFVAGES